MSVPLPRLHHHREHQQRLACSGFIRFRLTQVVSLPRSVTAATYIIIQTHSLTHSFTFTGGHVAAGFLQDFRTSGLQDFLPSFGDCCCICCCIPTAASQPASIHHHHREHQQYRLAGRHHHLDSSYQVVCLTPSSVSHVSHSFTFTVFNHSFIHSFIHSHSSQPASLHPSSSS